MPRRNDDDARRAADAEEERAYWDAIDDNKRAEADRESERRETSIEAMEKWFLEQFEDPQIETPRDGDEYLYPWGGPYEAPDVLHGAFGNDYPEDWIMAAAERLERDGTTEWAPTSHGDYYEAPDPDPDDELTSEPAQALLTTRILARLDTLEAAVAALPGLPGNIGHNAPPEDVGLPPYEAVEITEITTAIASARTALTQSEFDPATLTKLAGRFDSWGKKLGAYAAKKGDLVVDELIRNSVKLLTWGSAAALFTDLGQDLLELVRLLLGKF